MSAKCPICNESRQIETDGETVCPRCGFVYGIAESESFTICTDGHNKLGSKNILDDKLILTHLNKKKTRNIIERVDTHALDFYRCCDVLNLQKIVTNNAFYMFSKLRPFKLGIGKTAAFSIYSACEFSGVPCNIDDMIDLVRHVFGLKRMITLRSMLYSIKPTALDIGLVLPNGDLSDVCAIRNNIDPQQHIIASKLMSCFPGTSLQRAKLVHQYLSRYT
ncbi:MAG: hypothetical protein K8Q89_01490 [Nitrosarchaeum sp.]|nr:hypothetical protein [Nitrosarchaeum sp.]